MNLNQILDFLTGADGAGFLWVSWALSWAFEGAAWWQALSSKLKSLIFLGISGLLGVGAVYLKLHPAVVAAVEPYVQPLIYMVIAWLGSQVAHRMNPLRAKSGA